MFIKKRSIVLLQGIFPSAVFDSLKKRKLKEVFILEGRPSLTAAKKASKELLKRKIKPTLIADNMAGFLFARDLVKEVNIAYQNTDKNGAVCSIGGLILAVLGKRHRVTVCLHKSNAQSKLLGRPEEIFKFNGIAIAPKNIRGYVPLVEWIPKKYITKVAN